MFSLYRRHEDSCRFRTKGVRHIKCSCPVWMDGYDEKGKRQRRSLKTRSWSQAQARLVEIEAGRQIIEPPKVIVPSLSAAIAAYLEDCRARRLTEGTIDNYENSFAHLTKFFTSDRLSEVTLDGLTRFRSIRPVTAGSSIKEISHVRALLRFCVARKWIAENPAGEGRSAALKAPKATALPTMPFSEDEVNRIIAACDLLEVPRRDPPRAIARALILTMLYSGFRISDAVKLERSRVDMQTGRVLVRIMKTGVPLYTRLPTDAIAALEALPSFGYFGPKNTRYFFWNGHSQLRSAIVQYGKMIAEVLRLAEVENGHPHRFRDTFSVGLLLKGAELRTVQLLLGHKSIRTTEAHYSPFVTSMQRSLDEALSTLHFGASSSDTHAPVDPQHNTLGNSERNVLPFPRPKRA